MMMKEHFGHYFVTRTALDGVTKLVLRHPDLKDEAVNNLLQFLNVSRGVRRAPLCSHIESLCRSISFL